MPIHFVKTQTVTPTCILPCPLPPIELKITVPFAIPGFELQPGGKLTLKGGCTDCTLAVDLFVKITPFLASLGLPLCILQCALSLVNTALDTVNVVTGTVDVLNSLPPDPSKMTQIGKDLVQVGKDVLAVKEDCKCVLELVTPTGFCPFFKMVRDICRLAAALINCFATLLGDIVKIGLTAQFMRASPNINVRTQGKCLGQVTRNTLDNLNAQMDIIWAIVTSMTGIIVLLKKALTIANIPIPQELEDFDALVNKITAFQAMASGQKGGSIDVVIPQCKQLQEEALKLKTALNDFAEALNVVITGLCP